MSKSNGMSEENIENINKSDSNFAATPVNHHLLPDINFNGHCFINNNISIPKNVIYIYIYIYIYMYFLHTKYMVKKCKHKFYIK